MGIFKSSTKPPHAKPVAQGKGSPAAASLSIVGAGMTVHGDLETDGIVKVEGAVHGNVKAGSQVLVAKGGVVNGDIETSEAVVGGVVNGAIRAKERVEVQAGASIGGDVTTRRIAVGEGGTLNGLVRMGDGAGGQEVMATDPKGALRTLPASVPGRSSAPVARIAIPPRASSSGHGQ